MVGARLLLKWLETFPGKTWQDRWKASPIASAACDWKKAAQIWARTIERNPTASTLSAGLLALICADVIRPDFKWIVDSKPHFLRPAIASTRDPEGFARLAELSPRNRTSATARDSPQTAIARIVASCGGKVEDIVVGDVLALWQVSTRHRTRVVVNAYAALHKLGQFPPDAPATLRRFETRTGQVGVPDLVDRYGLQRGPVRDLIIDYLEERRTALDYSSLRQLAKTLAGYFWADIERHSPGVNSLRLPAEVVAAWKERIRKKTTRKKRPNGSVILAKEPRLHAPSIMMAVRAFYLDIGQWAIEEPVRWGTWAAPCPVSEAEASTKKLERQQKTNSDQRTRERLPVLPVLVRVANQRLKEARIRLNALFDAPPGEAFTVLGEEFVAPKSSSRADGKPVRARDASGRRRDLGSEEKVAFWAWATIEILRHTGIRIEELRELSHHSIIRYTLPSTGEVVPLLQIAPSKTEKERLILVNPELADVLSAVVSRVRGVKGVVSLIQGYDPHERVWNSPMPLLYQWSVNDEPRQIAENTIRKGLNETLEATGLTDAAGDLLSFQPHDFRRIFITDSILNGLPPHIAQVIAGHDSITSTMGYHAIYPEKVIEAHRAFIARRRSLRPSEEYRAVAEGEWDEFLGHFEKRKLGLGACGRAFGTECDHEHACVRCPVLIVGPDELPRLEEVRENLGDRISEAERQGWLGDVEQLSVSRSAAEEKIARIKANEERKKGPTFLGVPSFDQVASRAGSHLGGNP
ncbi:site-specific integrase [Streptomyces sp. C3-3]|uniref:site-specific integrase n=1 Tax=Streptomyces sp. C3-3 TaxID=2824901 RepID=UPI001FFD6C0E|nr:site-specific integrase [Streptomyces sp. C3-3]